jgi:hypothetical protein
VARRSGPCPIARVALPCRYRSGGLFAEGTVPTALRLVESATFPKGAMHLIYERAGEERAGEPAFASMA